MQKYGKIINGELATSNRHLDDYKRIEYAEIPMFDQTTQGIFQSNIVDEGEFISVALEVIDLPIEDLIDEEGSL